MANKLLLGIVAGATIGAAVALMDRKTRENTLKKATNLKTDAQYLYYNRDEVKEKAQGNLSKFQALVENVMENKEFYLEKLAELKETTPQINIQIQKTKEAFTKNKINEEPNLQDTEKPSEPEDVIHL